MSEGSGGKLRRRAALLAALAVPAGRAAWAQGAAADGVQALLTARVEESRDSLGYVAALLDGGEARLVTAGRSSTAGDRPLDGDSVFEIGSITKVFTALLLADMVGRGEVALDDPVARYLPPEGRPQAFDGKDMSLLDLATYKAAENWTFGWAFG